MDKYCFKRLTNSPLIETKLAAVGIHILLPGIGDGQGREECIQNGSSFNCLVISWGVWGSVAHTFYKKIHHPQPLRLSQTPVVSKECWKTRLRASHNLPKAALTQPWRSSATSKIRDKGKWTRRKRLDCLPSLHPPAKKVRHFRTRLLYRLNMSIQSSTDTG